jgi:hypothetical protein
MAFSLKQFFVTKVQRITAKRPCNQLSFILSDGEQLMKPTKDASSLRHKEKETERYRKYTSYLLALKVVLKRL